MTITTRGSQDVSFWSRFSEEVNSDATWVLRWVQENFEIAEVFDKGELIDAVRDEYAIDDVFTDSELEEWALDNGFVREN